MTNKVRTLLASFAIAVAGSAIPAFASESDPMHISVPFAFKAGKAILPAGDYVVQEEDSGLIMIRGQRGSAMLLGTAGGDASADKAGVSFERSEKGYTLKSVHGWGRISSSILPIAAGDK